MSQRGKKMCNFCTWHMEKFSGVHIAGPFLESQAMRMGNYFLPERVAYVYSLEGWDLNFMS